MHCINSRLTSLLTYLLTPNRGVVVVPDLDSMSRQKKGGQVPRTAVDVACDCCMRYIRSRCHDDLDKVSDVM